MFVCVICLVFSKHQANKILKRNIQGLHRQLWWNYIFCRCLVGLQILVLCLNGKARWCEKGKLLQCSDSKHVTCCKKRRSRKKERMRAKAGTRLKTLEQSWPVRIVLSLETLLTDDTPLVKQWWPDHISSKILLAKINDTIELEKVKMCVYVVLS